MNKLTLPRWWEALLLLLPIVGTGVSALILFLLPIGMIVVNQENPAKLVKAWPLLQGMLLLAPAISTIGLMGWNFFLLLPIGSYAAIGAGIWITSYVFAGMLYNNAVYKVGLRKQSTTPYGERS